MAMISIDNAVELTVKTWLGLPERARGVPGPARRKLEEASQSFPALLDLLDRYASGRLVGVGLDDIEWFHRLRNQLYHEGNGITVERSKVEAYLQLGRAIFENLFQEPLRLDSGTATQTKTGEFLALWNDAQAALRALLPPKEPGQLAYYRKAEYIERLSPELRHEYEELSSFRNELVHSLAPPDAERISAMLEKLQPVRAALRRAAN
jgi:hypothetical protein